LFQVLGPFSKSHKIAISNYKKVFPRMSEEEIRTNVLNSWNNLGKTFVEISILNKILNEKNKKIKLEGLEHLNTIKNKREQVIFFSIHQSNWELLVPTINKLGINVGAIYRHINNPYIDKLILKKRTNSLNNSKTFYSPKGKESAKDILKAINEGLSMIILVDQKDSSGNDVQLFNHNVKTQLGFLKIARKYNLKLIPIQTIRNKINNFSIIFHAPLEPFHNYLEETKAMSEIHKIIEKWILANPNQWLWQHQRFN
jgi:KDO2-lipid IV(A) lauroyltransferase